MLLLILQIMMTGVSGYFLFQIYKAKSSSKEVSGTTWKAEWDEEKKALEERFSVQLRSMRLLYEQTQKLMDEKQLELNRLFPPSLEETELQHLMNQQKIDPLLTLDQFEKEKSEFNAKCTLDLKTLLSEQLC